MERRKGLLIPALIALTLLSCTRRPDYPLTQKPVVFSSLNSTMVGEAPPVVEGLDFKRIIGAKNEPQNWLTYYGGYERQRFSTLSTINGSNVKRLQPAWVFQAGVIGLIAAPPTYAFEATPLVVDGTMFVSGWDGYVWALDAASGRLLWQYKHSIPLDVPLCCGNVNRGVAVAEGKVFVVTANGYLLALDARNGHLLWQSPFVDVRAGESATLAPLVVKHLVLVGSSGGEYGVRGHIDAFDVENGTPVWRRYNVPKPGEEGSESWSGTSWERGGGTAWVTGTYDPTLNLVYWGTGNPGPDFNGGERPGKNLYTDSVVAFNPDDGKLKWSYQWTPHDLWDYDGVNENILFDKDGQKLLAHFDKNGYLFVLDRTNGHFIRALKFAQVTWGDINEHTGEVAVKRVPSVAGTEICPGPAGAKEWSHASFSPRTGLLYVPVIEACAKFREADTEFKESMPDWGGDATVSPNEHHGAVRAFDPLTGRQAWSWETGNPIVSSTLSTAGGLVFVGEPNGAFVALDAATGAQLWQFQTGGGIHASPIAYSVQGKEYIAVPTGWGGWIKGFAPGMLGAPRGTALFAFSLPGG